MSGWIKAHRAMLDNPIVLKDAEHFAVWMWLLMNATHDDRDVWFVKERKTLKAGQLVTGRKKIAEALKISESKVQRILSLFEKEGQIEQVTTNKNRLITIINWNTYQSSEDESNDEAKEKREKGHKKIPRSSVFTPQSPQPYYSKSEQQSNGNNSSGLKQRTSSDRILENTDIERERGGLKTYKYPSQFTSIEHPLDDSRTTTEQQLNTEQECKNIKNEINIEKRESRVSASHFHAPTLSEVKKYVDEEKIGINAEVFFWYYESRDWFTGKNKMKDWKKTIKTWEAREQKSSHPPVAAPPLSPGSFGRSRAEQYRYNRQRQNRINEIWDR